jgi:hypothetical protein
VLHSHSLNAVFATLMDEAASEFKVTHLEMIKVCSILSIDASVSHQLIMGMPYGLSCCVHVLMYFPLHMCMAIWVACYKSGACTSS